MQLPTVGKDDDIQIQFFDAVTSGRIEDAICNEVVSSVRQYVSREAAEREANDVARQARLLEHNKQLMRFHTPSWANHPSLVELPLELRRRIQHDSDGAYLIIYVKKWKTCTAHPFKNELPKSLIRS